MMTPHATKPFYASQVHPAYLPTLHKSGQIEKRLAVAAVAAASIGYGLNKYKEVRIERQEQRAQSMHEMEQRRRAEAEAMMDAYGDRENLDSLEAAVKAYDAQRALSSAK